jgi:Ethanolamine utilization protein EutJ (predicted chaperonin)
MTDEDRPTIFLGVDIGKSAHYAVAVDRDGNTIYSKAVANDKVRCGCLCCGLARIKQRSSWINPVGPPLCC